MELAEPEKTQNNHQDSQKPRDTALSMDSQDRPKHVEEQEVSYLH